MKAAATKRGAKTNTTQDEPSSATVRETGRGRGGRGSRGAKTAAKLTEGSIAPIAAATGRGRGRGRGKK